MQSRTDVAEYLRSLAEQLDGGEEVQLERGGESVTLNPTEPLVLKLEGEWDPTGETDTESIELELV